MLHLQGSDNCSECRHFKDGPYCVRECPEAKYGDTGICEECFEHCVDGCTGPGAHLGEGGCKACQVALVDADDQVIQCLSPDTNSCDPGYFFGYNRAVQMDVRAN